MALKRRGMTLRIRERNGHFIQNVKAGEPSGSDLLARGEWEDAVDQNRPDPHAPHSGARLPDGVADRLRPLFVTDITRTTVEIEPESGTRIEAAIDEGGIRGIDTAGSEPVCEIELELKSGETVMLYEIASRLLDVAPLRIELRSKAERGYHLLEAAAPPAVHAEPVLLDPASSVGAALQAIGRSCLLQVLRNEPAVLSGQAEGVHQMRIAVRRLRSALAGFKKMLLPEDLDWITGELKWLVGALSEARNLDAFGTDLLEPARDALGDEAGLDDLAGAVDRLRHGAYERIRTAVLSERYTVLMLRLLYWFEVRGWRSRPPLEADGIASSTIVEAAPRLLDRQRRKVRQRSRHFDRLNAQQRHQLRIAGKKLRYTVELFGSLFDQHELQKFNRRLKRLQDDLGHANDVSVARELLRRLSRNAQPGVASTGARLIEWHERALAKGELKLKERLQQLNEAAPFWRPQEGSLTEPLRSL
jgi:inorganic triphosphatase YgiF